MYHALSFIIWKSVPGDDPIIEIPKKGYYVNLPYHEFPNYRFSKQMVL